MDGFQQKKIWRISQNGKSQSEDRLAIEEPLEIRLVSQGTSKSISITMRTPGNDFELAAGFLFTEGIIQNHNQIQSIQHVKSWNPEQQDNIVAVELDKEVKIDFQKLERHFYTSSSCGVCGKASIDAVFASGLKKMNDPFQFESSYIHTLPDTLRQAQNIFEQTGGLHAAAIFNQQGKLLQLCEDVGRHNALDKLIGTALLQQQLPLDKCVLLLSGRISFELVQKAAMAQIPILAAVGAPSSLAISLAEEVGMSIIGFVREQRFNIYSNPQRIK